MRSPRSSRRGAEALEFALTLPVLLIILGGLIDFGWFATHQSAVHAAASVGARAGSITELGHDPEATAVLAVQRALESAQLEGVEVTAALFELPTSELAIQVEVEAPYSGLWGLVSLPIDYRGSAVMRMNEQPLLQ